MDGVPCTFSKSLSEVSSCHVHPPVQLQLIPEYRKVSTSRSGGKKSDQYRSNFRCGGTRTVHRQLLQRTAAVNVVVSLPQGKQRGRTMSRKIVPKRMGGTTRESDCILRACYGFPRDSGRITLKCLRVCISCAMYVCMRTAPLKPDIVVFEKAYCACKRQDGISGGGHHQNNPALYKHIYMKCDSFHV